MDLFLANLLDEGLFFWILFVRGAVFFIPGVFCARLNLLSCLLLFLKISHLAGAMKEAGSEGNKGEGLSDSDCLLTLIRGVRCEAESGRRQLKRSRGESTR